MAVRIRMEHSSGQGDHPHSNDAKAMELLAAAIPAVWPLALVHNKAPYTKKTVAQPANRDQVNTSGNPQRAFNLYAQ